MNKSHNYFLDLHKLMCDRASHFMYTITFNLQIKSDHVHKFVRYY